MDKNKVKSVVMENIDEVVSPFNEVLKLEGGFEAVCKIAEMLGGANCYIPSKRMIFRRCIETAVRREYDGKNIRELVKRYGYSDTQIRNILKSA